MPAPRPWRAAPPPAPAPAARAPSPAADPMAQAIAADRAQVARERGSKAKGKAKGKKPERATVIRDAARSGEDPNVALVNAGLISRGQAATTVVTRAYRERKNPSAALRRLGYATPNRGPGGVLGVVARGAGDVLDVITGLPNAAVLVGKNVAAGGTGLYGHTAGRVLPGGEAAREFTAGVGREDAAAGKAIAADYRYRYGPLFSGDFGVFRERLSEHPGFFALDLGSAVSAGGGLARAGAKGVAKVAPETVAGQAASRMASRSMLPGGARYREPKVLTQQVGEKAPEAVSLVRARRSYTPNPLTRPLQKAADIVREKTAEAIGNVGEELRGTGGISGLTGRAARAIGPEGQFAREASRQARDLKFAFQDEAARQTGDLANDFLRTRKGLASTIGRDLTGRAHEEAALYLHMKGLLDVPGLTPRQARDRVVRTMRAEQEARPEMKKGSSLRVIQSFEDIPDELLDLEAAPAHLREAVTAGRALSEKASARMVIAGKVTPETAQAVATRPGEVIHGGSRFDPKAGAFTTPDPYTPTGKGVYLPDIPVDRLTRTAAKAAGQFGRITAEPVKQSHGFLLLTGNLVTDSRLPVYATQKAVAASLHPRFVDDFVKRFGAREGGPSGKLAVGPRAVEALKADPDNVVLISRRALLDGMRAGDDLPAGKFLSEDDLSGAFIGKGQLAAAEELLRTGKARDVIAVPKAAAETIRAGMVAPSRVARGLDTALNAWRAGILAFAPRWYVNNLFGNTLQYGILAGRDIAAIRQAARPAFRKAIPERIAASTLARDARGNLAGRMGSEQGALSSMAERGFEMNQWMEAHLRRGAYLAASKKVLRSEGTKARRLSDADLARLIETMPDELKLEAIRKTELFMGDYRRLSQFERSVLRRVFPFYSWLRVIGKLTASLPLQHPLRTEAIALASKMGTATENPEDWMRPFWQRGRINLPGGLAIRTTGANPFATWGGAVAALGTGDVGGALNELASGSFNPLIRIGGEQFAGRNLFTGQDITAPPGWEDTAAQFGRRPVRWNEATGRFDSVEIKPSLATSILEAVPLVSNVRAAVAQGRQPYDVIPTTDLLLGRRPDWQMYRPEPKTPSGTRRIPGVSALGAYLGVPVVGVDRAAEFRAYLDMLRRGAEAERSTVRAEQKASRGR